MARLVPRAKSPTGKSFRSLRDRLLAGDGVRKELASRAAWAGVHLGEMDARLAGGGTLSTAEAAQYEALTRALAAVLREMREHEMRPAIGPLHHASAGSAA